MFCHYLLKYVTEEEHKRITMEGNVMTAGEL